MKRNNAHSAIHSSNTFRSHFCLQVIRIFKTVIRVFTAPLRFLTCFWQADDVIIKRIYRTNREVHMIENKPVATLFNQYPARTFWAWLWKSLIKVSLPFPHIPSGVSWQSCFHQGRSHTTGFRVLRPEWPVQPRRPCAMPDKHSKVFKQK